MGIPEVVFEEEFAVDDAHQAAAREPDRAEAADAPSCSAALGARSIEEQVVPI